MLGTKSKEFLVGAGMGTLWGTLVALISILVAYFIGGNTL